jgi:hypothetical protein
MMSCILALAVGVYVIMGFYSDLLFADVLFLGNICSF